MARRKRGSTSVAFGDVVRLYKERTSDPDADGFDRYVGLEHLDPGDLRIRRWGDVADGTTFTNVFRPGQVLFGKRRSYQGKVGIADFEGVCSSDIYVLEPKDVDVLLPDLLPFICQSEAFREFAVGTSAGSLSPRTNWSSLATFEFELPDSDAQMQVVDVLRAIQRTTVCLQGVATTADQTRSSLLEHALGSGQWPMRPLGELANVTSGGTPSRSNPAYWNGDIPWVKTGEVDYSRISTAEESITPAGLENSSARIVPAGAVLMAMYGQGPTLGRVARLSIDAATNQACAILEPSEELDGSFLYFYLWHRYQAIRGLARGASQPNLNLGLVKSIPIPQPSIAIQQHLSTQLDSLVSAHEAASRRAESAQRFRDVFICRHLRTDST